MAGRCGMLSCASQCTLEACLCHKGGVLGGVAPWLSASLGFHQILQSLLCGRSPLMGVTLPRSPSCSVAAGIAGGGGAVAWRQLAAGFMRAPRPRLLRLRPWALFLGTVAAAEPVAGGGRVQSLGLQQPPHRTSLLAGHFELRRTATRFPSVTWRGLLLPLLLRRQRQRQRLQLLRPLLPRLTRPFNSSSSSALLLWRQQRRHPPWCLHPVRVVSRSLPLPLLPLPPHHRSLQLAKYGGKAILQMRQL